MQHDSKSLDDNRLLFEDIFDERMETDANDDNVNNNNQLVNTYANHNHHHHQQQQQPHQHHHQHHHHRKRVIFDIAASGNVTTLLGRTAYLNCRVKSFSMGLRSVSIFSFLISVILFIFVHSFCHIWCCFERYCRIRDKHLELFCRPWHTH